MKQYLCTGLFTPTPDQSVQVGEDHPTLAILQGNAVVAVVSVLLTGHIGTTAMEPMPTPIDVRLDGHNQKPQIEVRGAVKGTLQFNAVEEPFGFRPEIAAETTTVLDTNTGTAL